MTNSRYIAVLRLAGSAVAVLARRFASGLSPKRIHHA